MIPNVLTIAGSDPSGGAGIQADLKTFSALRAFGTSVVTALTAQNTRGVFGIHAVPIEFIHAQADALFADLEIAAVKVGMVGTPAVAAAVATLIERYRPRFVVVDPVMVAKGGDPLLDEDAVARIRERLVPIATVITPNVYEAGALLDRNPPQSLEEMTHMARALHDLGSKYVLIKGGNLTGDASPDVLFDGTRTETLTTVRIETRNTHGTGCTLSSAIAALVAQSTDVPEAVRAAKRYVSGAISAGSRLRVGTGRGPVHHFHDLWR